MRPSPLGLGATRVTPTGGIAGISPASLLKSESGVLDAASMLTRRTLTMPSGFSFSLFDPLEELFSLFLREDSAIFLTAISFTPIGKR